MMNPAAVTTNAIAAAGEGAKAALAQAAEQRLAQEQTNTTDSPSQRQDKAGV